MVDQWALNSVGSTVQLMVGVTADSMEYWMVDKMGVQMVENKAGLSGGQMVPL